MYRLEDINKINEHINDIKDNAAIKAKTLYEPTFQEINEVVSAIKYFIKKRNRITYGGYAQNSLISIKNKNECFYKIIDGVNYNLPNVADLEFYSPVPINDGIELAEELKQIGFKFVECKEGEHNETYKIFVNFINYCDITYMPVNIYNNLPTIKIEGINCTHPHFMLIDTYRVLTDPMMSYWRLDKSIERFQKLITYYPINQVYKDKQINLNCYNINDIQLFIRKKIIRNSKLIVIGFYAYNYYIKKINKNNALNNYSYYELICNNLEKDATNIYRTLKFKYGDSITVKEYYPFFQFTDRKIDFFYNKILILRLYGNNGRCIVYNYSDVKHIYFGTYNLVFMYLLFNYYIALINNEQYNTELYATLIIRIYNARNKYLDKKGITVLDKSPFQDFTLECYGTPIDMRRQNWLEGIKKKKQGKKPRFQYTPTGKRPKIPTFKFSNSSGNIIVNEKYLVLKV
jgi:hypothetical protein